MKADEICAEKLKLESEEYSKYQVRKVTITERLQYLGQDKPKIFSCKVGD